MKSVNILLFTSKVQLSKVDFKYTFVNFRLLKGNNFFLFAVRQCINEIPSTDYLIVMQAYA